MATIVFPSQESWITPRTTEAKIDSNNCMLILPKKISAIKRVIVNAETIDVRFGQSGEPSSRTQKLNTLYFAQNLNSRIQSLDISDYIVEQAKYHTLPIKNINAENLIIELCANNAHYYEYNDNSIFIIGKTFQGSISFWAKTSAWNMTIQASFEKLLKYNTIYNYNEQTQEFIPIYSRPVTLNTLPNNPMSAEFRVYYTPLGESVKLQVPKTNPQENQFCIPYSQQQPIVDNVTLGREMQSVVNRTGCEKKEVVRTLTNIKQYRSPHGGYFYREKDANGKPTGNMWRLTKSQLKIYSDSLMQVMETWSKNWSYRSENVPINREFRSWNIPADIVQRNLLWQDYCLISEKENLSLPDNSLLSNKAKWQAVVMLNKQASALKSAIFDRECSIMWLYTKDGNYFRSGVVLNCSAFGFGNSIVFSGKTQDNLSAGIRRVQSDNNDNDWQYCRDVYYCDYRGELEDSFIQIGNNLWNTVQGASIAYPYFASDDRDGINGIPITSGKLFKDDMQFRILKDPCEQLNFTYQLHMLTDNPNLVIGPAWSNASPLVKQVPDSGMAIKYWYLTSYLPAGAKVMTTMYGKEAPATQEFCLGVFLKADSIGFTFDFSNVANDASIVGACVTDEENNIILAYNSTEKTTYTVYYTHFYQDIYQAIKNK